MASDIEGSFPKQNDWDLYASEVNNNLMPVGGILAFYTGGTGVSIPGNWVECNGQVLIDSDSPINGVTIPLLNSSDDDERSFLRGNSTSGGTGGEYDSAVSKHKHTTTYTTTSLARRITIGDRTYPTLSLKIFDSLAINILPTSMQMTWIMRIK